MKYTAGFTLIELMIVVAIIAIIAAIAIPNLLRSRMSANEASAAGGVRTICVGEFGFQAAGFVPDPATGVGQYGTIAQLGGSTPAFIDAAIASGTKSGYTYVATPLADSSAPTFTATAQPTAPGRTGTKSFFVDESGVIRFSGVSSTLASSSSLPMN